MAGGESRWHAPVVSWLTRVKGCQHAEPQFLFHGVNLLEGDVVGWVGQQNVTRAEFACELKDYPLPIGSGGYGSVGQALMLSRFVTNVYVGCAASGGQGWQSVIVQPNIRALLRVLDIAPATDFDGYLRVAGQIFRAFFGRHQLGLVVVEREGDAATVHEVVQPRSERAT